MKERLNAKDFDSYYRLRVALDALRDAVLVQYALCKSGGGRKRFTETVEQGVDSFLGKVVQTPQFKQQWLEQNETFLALVSESIDGSGCPPGFVEVDGRCVRVP
jgi:hypothetical protein